MLSILLLATIIGAIEGGMIFWVPEEPHKAGVLFGATLRGFLLGLLIGLSSLFIGHSWLKGSEYGALYGFLLGLLIVLPQGGLQSKDAKYILPFSTGGGLLTGLLAVWFLGL